MNVFLGLRAPCALCGCRLRGFWSVRVRVNKASLVTTGVGLVVADRACPECGFAAMDPPARSWALDADSADRVAAARARKGWAA